MVQITEVATFYIYCTVLYCTGFCGPEPTSSDATGFFVFSAATYPPGNYFNGAPAANCAHWVKYLCLPLPDFDRTQFIQP